MISFDITNLYTNVPTNETLEIVKTILDEKIENKEDSKNIYNLFDLCIKQNFCTFNNQCYCYNEGLPMGSPLSGLLADIFLNNIENNKIMNDNNPFKKNIILWQRYVDDIIVFINTKNNNNIDNLHTYLNTLHKNIQFTVEIEESNKINFLDVTIEKTKNKIKYNIYRKPT